MRLENWSIQDRQLNTFFAAPELAIPCLHGAVYGSPHFPDGYRIRTSAIKGRRGESVVTYTGHEYELGAVNPEYEKFAPGAREDLMRKLKEVSCA